MKEQIDIRKINCRPTHSLSVLTWLAFLSVSSDNLGAINASITEEDFDPDTVDGALGIRLSNCTTLDGVTDLIYDIEGLAPTLLTGVTMESGVDIEDFESVMSSILNDVNECFMANMKTLSNEEDGSFNLSDCAICLNA